MSGSVGHATAAVMCSNAAGNVSSGNDKKPSRCVRARSLRCADVGKARTSHSTLVPCRSVDHRGHRAHYLDMRYAKASNRESEQAALSDQMLWTARQPISPILAAWAQGRPPLSRHRPRLPHFHCSGLG
jgi:hypothetical protein